MQLVTARLRRLWYDLTATDFEGNGVCYLVAYGRSLDHRAYRAQVDRGLALTQRALPIAHDVFADHAADGTTVARLAKQMKESFGLPEAIVVGEPGLISAATAQAFDELELG